MIFLLVFLAEGIFDTRNLHTWEKRIFPVGKMSRISDAKRPRQEAKAKRIMNRKKMIGKVFEESTVKGKG